MMYSKTATLIKSLQNPALFPHQVDYFKIIETHISWVLLTGLYAYKIKKPVNFGFLDFSSLDKRRYFCHEELRLNARLADNIYLEVVTISGTVEQPEIFGSGNVMEYAVKMRQFDPDKTFDHLQQHNRLTSEQIKKTAKIIAGFHQKIDIAAVDTAFGSEQEVMQPVRENFIQILQLDCIEKEDVLNDLLSWSEQHFFALQTDFNQRKRDGFIRSCHGDLHLSNIALIDGQVVPFDGIEFNPSLYWIDVINDIAFLIMDLQDKGRLDLAFQFLNAYLQQSGDYEGLKLLRFYLVYRAMVMAKVSAIRASQTNTDENRRHAMSDYRGYLQLAVHYTQTATPFIIIMHGVSGSGKSWLSEQMIDHVPAIRIRSDIERKRCYQQNKDADGGLYGAQANIQTYQRLLQLTKEIISAGYNVIVDATFLEQKRRQMFFQLAEQATVPFCIVHTVADKHTMQQRIQQRVGQGDNVSDADQQVLESQLSREEALTAKEQDYAIEIETNQQVQLSKLWQFLKTFEK